MSIAPAPSLEMNYMQSHPAVLLHIPHASLFLPPGEQPDLCIGTDDYHTPRKLADGAEAFARERGYSVCFNRPYSGAIVPAKFYQKDARVSSIMIELNRRLYLTKEFQKSESYRQASAFCRELLSQIITIASCADPE